MRWAIVLSLLAAGCGGERTSGRATPVVPPRTLTVSPPTLAEGVVAMDPLCAEGADERCDGVDGDCDAHIDEGCEGTVSGAIEIAVAWNGGSDVDLHVHAPGQPSRASSRADCGHPAEARIERAVFDTAAPGEYRVELEIAGPCGASDPALQTSVSVTALGTSLGAFNRGLIPGERVPILSFTVE